MEFKFNFSQNNETDNVSKKTDIEPEKQVAREICITEQHKERVGLFPSINCAGGTKNFRLVCPSTVQEYFKENCTESAICKAIEEHSDLLSGKYEGGLKIWEGAVDLCDYLATQKIDWNGKTVAELGCGAGMPGVFALEQGAKVIFQDFNEEVIDTVTISNVLLNADEELWDYSLQKCRFLSGDWESVQEYLTKKNDSQSVDVILTSETIYNPKYYSRLYNLMKSMLAKDGEIFLASKSYYFGVGGGTQQFIEFVNEDGAFECDVCWNTTEGVRREILHFRWKNL